MISMFEVLIISVHNIQSLLLHKALMPETRTMWLRLRKKEVICVEFFFGGTENMLYNYVTMCVGN